jgi:hypothetical protein
MLPQNETHLAPSATANMPGICTVKAVSTEHCTVKSFADILKDTSTNNYPLTGLYIGIVNGFDWLDVNLYKNIKTDFDEGEEQTPQGKLFTYTVSIQLANDDYETRGKIINAYDNRQWILEVKLRSGSKRLLGTNERGCDFKAELNSGTARKQGNFYQCGFQWKSHIRAHYVS